MKVYVVWSVDSSPYAAFSSMHAAERLVEEKGDWWQFEELEIDRVPAKNDADHYKDVTEAIAEGIPVSLFAALDELTDEQRLTVFSVYCTHCGSPTSGCQCWNDE